MAHEVHSVGVNTTISRPLAGDSVSADASLVPLVDRVTGAAARTTLGTGANPAGTGNARVLVDRVVPQTTVRVERLPRPRIDLFVPCSAATCHTIGTTDAQHEHLQDLYYDLKELIAPPGCTEFRIQFGRRTVTYHENNVRVIKDLHVFMEANPEIARKVEEYQKWIEDEVWKAPLSNANYKAHEKGSIGGSKPLMRTNDALRSLPRQIGNDATQFGMDLYSSTGADQGRQDSALKRMLAAEKQIKHITTKIGAEITAIDGRLAITPHDPQLLRAKASLESKKAKFEEMDSAALYSAMAFCGDHPTVPESVAAAAALSQAMAGEIHKKADQISTDARRSLAGWPILENFCKEVDLQPNNNYPIDVGALLFAALPAAEARQAYIDYCNANHIYAKDEVLEDSIIRSIINPAQINQRLQNMFQDLADAALRQRLEQELVVASNHAQAVKNDAVAIAAADQPGRIAELRTRHGL